MFKLIAIGSGIASLVGTLNGIELLASCLAAFIGYAWYYTSIVAPRQSI